MRTHIGSMRVTKATWYANGGFANSRCWRRHTGRCWQYFYRVED